MEENLLKEKNDLKFALNDLLLIDTHIGIYYKGYVDDYFHKESTNILKPYLNNYKEEMIDIIKKRIKNIDDILSNLHK